MKNFYKQNYYELLEVSPDSKLEEITQAFHQALEAFNRDSVAIYSLFDDSEREQLLAKVKDAYRVLSNSKTRMEYDEKLTAEEEPELSESEIDYDDKAEDDLSPQLQAGRMRKIHRPLESLIKKVGEPLELVPGQILTGSDLQRLRRSRGVNLLELSERIKVNIELLQFIESDLHDRLPVKVYVRGFLMAYAKALQLDAEELAMGYLNGMAE